MDSAQYIELLIMAREGSSLHGMNFVGGLIAFLLVSHFVGKDLGKYQAIFLTVIYSLFSFLTIYSMYWDLSLQSELIKRFFVEHPETASYYYYPGDGEFLFLFSFLVSGIYLFAWLGSVVNLFVMRRDA